MGVTLREGDREYFYEALDRHFPGLKQRYIDVYGNSYEVTSPDNERLMRVFNDICKKSNIISDPGKCFGYMQEFPEDNSQMSIFDLM
jgi:hypothetical protein